MPSRTGAVVVVALACLTLGSCGGEDPEPSSRPSATTTQPSEATEPSAQLTPTATPTPPPTSTPTSTGSADRLPIGKSDLDVSPGAYLTPQGFVPELQLNVTGGWSSAHRDLDGFDLGMPDPDRDAPLVAVVFITPPEGNAADALSEIEARANGTVRSVPGLIGSIDAKGLDITGGTGQLVASAQGGIALDATPEGRMQVSAADVRGKPLVVVIYVPDATRWKRALPLARALVNGTAPAS